MGERLENFKEGALIAGIGATVLLAWIIAVPFALAYTGYNFITRNQTSVKFPHQIRIPKETRKIKSGNSDRIEITGEDRLGTYGVQYEIRHINENTNRVLAETMAFYTPIDDVIPFVGDTHETWVLFPDKKSLILKSEKKVNIKCNNGYDLNGLKDLAYKTALSVATQIGGYTRLPVVDQSINRRRQYLENRVD
jgi:hypothetical protein